MNLNKRPELLDNDYYRPYMDITQFIALARAVKIEVWSSSLERLEKERALFPALVLAMPDGFSERLEKIHDNQPQVESKGMQQWFSNPRIRCSQFELTQGSPVFDNYIKVHQGIENPDARGRYREVLEEGFPLEQEMEKSASPLLIDASHQAFAEWDSLRLPGLFIDTQHRCYAPWQVIELYDVITTHQIHERASRREDDEWSSLRKSAAWTRSNKIAHPIHPVEFERGKADVTAHWPSPWSAWRAYFQKVADFQWCQRGASRLYWELLDKGASPHDSWNETQALLKIAADRHALGTTLDEWTRFLNALYALARDLDSKEKQRLSELVVKTINDTAALIKQAYDVSTVDIVDRCDGKEYLQTNSRMVSDKQLRLLYLLDPEEWVFRYQLRGDVRKLSGVPSVTKQRKSVPMDIAQLNAGTKESFLQMLRSDQGRTLTGPFVEWYLLLRSVDTSHSTHIRRWGVLRTLLAAMESKSREWFNTNSLPCVLRTAFPSRSENNSKIKGWQSFYDDDWLALWKVKYQNAAPRNITTVEQFIQVAVVLYGYESSSNQQSKSGLLGIHILMAYFARNWSAHVGDNPPRVEKDLERFVFRSVLRTLMVLWQERPLSARQ